MSRSLAPLFLVAASAFAPSAVAQDPQCGGTGGAILEIEAVDGNVIGPGTNIVIRLIGEPFEHFCLLCDTGDEPVVLPILGQVCLPFSPGLAVVAGVFPATGEIEIPVSIPNDPGLTDGILCCLFIDVNLALPENIDISNRICMCPGFGCEDKIQELELSTTLTYTGPFPVAVTATARKNDEDDDLIGSTTTQFDPNAPATFPVSDDDAMTIENITRLGDEITVIARIDASDFGNSGRLSANTYFDVTVGDVCNVETIHTSCSQPIGLGFVFDEFLITDLVDPSKDDVCDGDKPAIICATYTGEDCSATVTAQDSDKFSCSGDPAFAPTVFVRASDEEDPNDNGANVWFEGTVNLGEMFEINADNAGEDKLKAETFVHVFDMQGGNLLQVVEFHTSCSQPIRLGDQYGSIRIDCFVGEDEVMGSDLCDAGDPEKLTMTYTGDDCSATSHNQDDNKVSCSGDPMGLPMVYILATDEDDPLDNGARVWFSGNVTLGSQFVIDALNAGEDDLKAETFVYVYDMAGGTLLQSIEFHTSCSQPLELGNQFGSVRLDGFVAR